MKDKQALSVHLSLGFHKRTFMFNYTILCSWIKSVCLSLFHVSRHWGFEVAGADLLEQVLKEAARYFGIVFYLQVEIRHVDHDLFQFVECEEPCLSHQAFPQKRMEFELGENRLWREILMLEVMDAQ